METVERDNMCPFNLVTLTGNFDKADNLDWKLYTALPTFTTLM